MRTRFVHRALLVLLLIYQFSICLGKESPDPDDSSKYLNAVREFADNALKYGRDTYGPKHTPLLVDGLNIHTHEPVKWIDPDGTKWILSNFASQQTLLRTLDGLTTITGDPKYRQAAIEAIRYAFENLQAPNGLLYWGQCTAYDALKDRVHTDGNRHVLKVHYPYYELMWQVNPEATRRFIEAYWSAHIIDWSNLDMDRIASLTEVLEEPWNHEYKGGPVFFKGKGAAFLSTGLSLIHAGITLHKFSNQEQPYTWSVRLAGRYIDTRHPKTGISAFLYNNPWNTLGDDMKEHFVDPYTTLFPLQPFDVRYTYYPEDAIEAEHWISMLLVGKMLGEEGKEFSQWTLEELTAWGKASYRKKDNSFAPILTDGTSIEGYVLRTLPDGLNVAKPLPADALFFWAYTLVYRATGDRFMWKMVRDIASGNNFGDIGESPDDRPQLKMGALCSSPYGVLGFLELYAKTNRSEFLQMARCIGDNIINRKCHKSFFVPSKNHIYSRFDCFEPLALLHLYTAIKPQSEHIPQVWPSNPLFVPPYRYQRQGVDRRLIYTLTETTEPPLSLQEAAAIGDINVVSSLLKKGEPINGSDDSLRGTALHRAAMKGHLEVVELLLNKGARIDAQDDFPGGTPLDYAAEKGHKEVVELLIAHGANINAKRGWPVDDTPLHSAARAGRRDVVELLIEKGAEVNAKNKDGQAPVDVVGTRNRMEIVELLLGHGATISNIHTAAAIGDQEKVKTFLENGIDINAKDSQGMTALHHAAQGGHREVVKLLVSKGANLNAMNGGDENTPLHLAVVAGHKDIVELLAIKGADLDTKNVEGFAPLHYAVSTRRLSWWETRIGDSSKPNDLAIIGLLISHGADVNMKSENGATPLSLVRRRNVEIVELLQKHGAKD